MLNSFRGHDFKTIPFASIRIYEGTPKKVNEEMNKIRERFEIYMSRFNDKFFSDDEGNLALDYNIIEKEFKRIV